MRAAACGLLGAAVVLAGCASLIGVDEVALWDASASSEAGATEAAADQSVTDGDAGMAEGSGDAQGAHDASADQLSGEGGGDADAMTVEACVPREAGAACAAANCGQVDIGCGVSASCGTCGTTEVCEGDGGPSLCAFPDGGCTPGSRYVVLDPGNGAGGSGTGLVLDRSTGLAWMRYEYTQPNPGEGTGLTDCMNRGMALPSESQALGIASSNQDTCAWPLGWLTWTTTSAGLGWYVIESGGTVDTGYLANYGSVLCVAPYDGGI